MRRTVDDPAMAPLQPDPAAVRILLVDDKPQNLLALEALLGDLRLDLVRAESGAEALRQVLQDDFAVILLDVLMPGMDGLETAALIRSRSRETPIIFITAAGRDEDLIARGYALGAVDYIVKPIHPAILRSKVAVFIALFRKTAQVREQAAALARVNTDLEEQVRARTAQLQAAQAAAERERARLEEIFAQVPAAIAVLAGPDHVVTYVNPAGERIAGRRAAAMLGRPVREAFPELAGQGIFNPLDEVYRTGTPYVGTEVPARYDRDGDGVLEDDGVLEEGYFTFVYHPMRDANGVVTGVLQHAWEVTDQVLARRRADELARQVAAEAALRKSEARAGAILDATPDACVIVDGQGRIARVNAATERLFGYGREELLGQPVELLLPERFRRGHVQHRASYLAAPRPRPMGTGQELYARRKDGAELPVEISLSPLETAEGVLTISAIRDITLRKQAEEALRWANANLEKANQAKSAFLATMSHEIRTPMNGVIGLTSLLLGTPLTPEQQQYVTAIQSSGDALLTLIDDILDLSKIEAGHLSLEVQPLDLRQVASEVVDVFTAPVRAKGLHISAHVDPAVPPVLEGDAGRLRQVLTNLVGNAVKFTEHGAVEVRVDLVEEEPEGALLRLSVRDTGIGIAPALRATLFEPFTQADASTTRRYGGTGLGLAIAKRLVALMGGEIGVESAVGQGSTFWVTLHLARGAAPRGVSGAPVQGAPAAPAAQRAGRAARGRVLVAEDNAINQLVAARLLEKLGYVVDTVANGQHAVEAVRQGPYDLVLMDCHMPQMDGFAATAAIRRHEAGRGQHTPIVALTADALVGDAEKSLAAGMDDHLTKPITLERLAAVVGRWIAGSGAADPSDDAREVLDPGVLAALQGAERRSHAGLLARLITLYLRDIPAHLVALQEAVAQEDAGRVEEVAHGLRGSSAQLGATRMASLCAALQEAAGAHDLSEAAALLADLTSECVRVRAALQAVLSEANTS